MVFHPANEPGALWLACISLIPCIHCSVFRIDSFTLRAATEIFRDSDHGHEHTNDRLATGRSLMCLSGQTRESPRKAHMESDVLLQAKIRTHSPRLRSEFMSQFCTFQTPHATQKHFYVSCQCTSFRGCHAIQKQKIVNPKIDLSVLR